MAVRAAPIRSLCKPFFPAVQPAMQTCQPRRSV